MEGSNFLNKEQKASVELLSNFLKENDVVIFDSVTDIKLKGGKKNQYQGKVKRIVQNQYARPNINGLFSKLMNEHLIDEYENALKEGKEVEKPETYVASKPRWGTYVADGVLFHNDQIYVSLLPFRNEETVHTITLSDKPIENPSEIEGFPTDSSSSKSPVSVRMYNIKNITNIRNDKGEVLKVDIETGNISNLEK